MEHLHHPAGEDVWAALAKKFEAAHPDVKIKIVPLENEAYKSKMTALTASGKLPGHLPHLGRRRPKQQVDAGLVEDLTADTASWADGLLPAAMAALPCSTTRPTAIPFDIGMVGFWYNKALFAKAGDHRAADHLEPASSTP